MCALHKQGHCSRPEGMAASQAGPAPSLWVSQSLALFISFCFNFFFFSGAEGGTPSLHTSGKCTSAKLHRQFSFLSHLTALAQSLLIPQGWSACTSSLCGYPNTYLLSNCSSS